MNTIYALIQIPNPPPVNPPSPSPLIEWGIVITAVITGAAYLGKWILEQTATKERVESDLMRSLIANLQEVQSQLIRDSKEAKLELIGHIDLKDTVSRMVTLLKDDVGRALGTQGGMYAKTLENQSRMEIKLDAANRRLDDVEKTLEQILEKLN